MIGFPREVAPVVCRVCHRDHGILVDGLCLTCVVAIDCGPRSWTWDEETPPILGRFPRYVDVGILHRNDSG